MQWTEVSVNTTNEAVEAVSNILMDFGAAGVNIKDADDFKNVDVEKAANEGKLIELSSIPHLKEGAIVSAYFPDDSQIEQQLNDIQKRVAKLTEYGLNPGDATVVTDSLSEHNWATEWEKYYHPLRVTRFQTIVPSWEDYSVDSNAEFVVKLDPGMAFGTGTHPTTKLSMQALETVIRGGESMIDVGTGSGVLAIAAKKLGVGKIYAYDVDDIAVRSAKENINLNFENSDIEVAANDLLKGINKQVDLVVANILAEIIVPLVPQAYANLKENGYFITAGIINSKVDEVKQAITDHQFKIEQILNMGDWYSIIARKPNSEGE
ncbi:50S ribosomal protein L11 methyltransferase [Lentilactobacillus sp. Marseille-Q4993]|uniref:50S ribosomal protein L11 methyltransferase n=1 Tax=Lentilactobacillus sp. Marseille-Q4993 TaxID=3039492 RepID=UPI0024BD2634|nr:50S ribosomal protein L11 methyltransferase [Lentilactobacillus sp. Marseille-Q4993]